MLEKIPQEQFEHIIDLLIMYKQMNLNKEVYLNENSIKEAILYIKKNSEKLSEKLSEKVESTHDD